MTTTAHERAMQSVTKRLCELVSYDNDTEECIRTYLQALLDDAETAKEFRYEIERRLLAFAYSGAVITQSVQITNIVIDAVIATLKRMGGV